MKVILNVIISILLIFFIQKDIEASDIFSGRKESLDSLTTEERNINKDFLSPFVNCKVNFELCQFYLNSEMALIYHDGQLLFQQYANQDSKENNVIYLAEGESQEDGITEVHYELDLAKKFQSGITCIKINKDEDLIFIGYHNGMIRILKKIVEIKKEKKKITYSVIAEMNLFHDTINNIDISSDSELIVISDVKGNIHVLNFFNKNEFWTYSNGTPINHIVLSPDKSFVVFTDKSNKIYLATIPMILGTSNNHLSVKYELTVPSAITSLISSHDANNQIFVWSDQSNRISYFHFINLNQELKIQTMKEKAEGLNKLYGFRKEFIYSIEKNNHIGVWSLLSNNKILEVPTNHIIKEAAFRNDSNYLTIAFKESIVQYHVFDSNMSYHHLKYRYEKKVNYAVKKWKKEGNHESGYFYASRITPSNLKYYLQNYIPVSLNNEIKQMFEDNMKTATIKEINPTKGDYEITFQFFLPLKFKYVESNEKLRKERLKQIKMVLKNPIIKKPSFLLTDKGILITELQILGDNVKIPLKSSYKRSKPAILYFNLEEMDLYAKFDHKLKGISFEKDEAFFNIVPIQEMDVPEINPKDIKDENDATVLIIDNWNYDLLPCAPFSSYDARLVSRLFSNQFGVEKRNIYFYRNVNQYALSNIIFSTKQKSNSLSKKISIAGTKKFIFYYIGKMHSSDSLDYFVPTDGNIYTQQNLFSWDQFLEWTKVLNATEITVILESKASQENIKKAIAKDPKKYGKVSVLVASSKNDDINQFSSKTNYNFFTYIFAQAILNKKEADMNGNKIISLNEFVEYVINPHKKYFEKLLEEKQPKQTPFYFSLQPISNFYYY